MLVLPVSPYRALFKSVPWEEKKALDTVVLCAHMSSPYFVVMLSSSQLILLRFDRLKRPIFIESSTVHQ